MDVQQGSTLFVATMEWVFPIIFSWRERVLLLVKANPLGKYIMSYVQVRMTISSHLFNFLFRNIDTFPALPSESHKQKVELNVICIFICGPRMFFFLKTNFESPAYLSIWLI